MGKPFGKSLLIDLYDCKPSTLNDLELIYSFLENLVGKLGMNSFSPPIVIHGPRDANGIELYPDKEGVSGIVFLIESSIVIHTIIPTRFISIDVYTCGELIKTDVEQYIKDTFSPAKWESVLIERGTSYNEY